MSTKPVRSSRVARFLRVGPIMMTLGAALILAGVVGSTVSTNGGNQSCPSGSVLIAKFNYFHGYSFEEPAGNEHVVTLSSASASGAHWSSTLAVSGVIVKGGPASVLTTYSPPQYSGTFSNAGLPKVGNDKNLPDISNVQFCGPVNGSTTTSTTTSTSTTTTSLPATTTTHHEGETTTTHHEGETTTTHHEGGTTTTHAPTTTTSSTTTTSTSTTTTSTTTTTSVPTTSSTAVAGETSTIATTTSVGPTTTTEHKTTTSESQQGSTTSIAVVTSTSLVTPNGNGTLPFTGSSSMPIVALGVVLLATGLTLTLSGARRRARTRA